MWVEGLRRTLPVTRGSEATELLKDDAPVLFLPFLSVFEEFFTS